MRHKIIFSAIALMGLVTAGAGCGTAAPETGSEQPAANQETATPTTLANPASVKCQDDGLGFRMGENEYGQYGVCVFDDGSECEEWAYFRGECEKGDCRKWEGCPKMMPGGK